MDVECTCSALRMAARRLSQAYDAALAPEKLSVSQYAVLSNLAKREAEGPPSMGELAERLGLDRTTLTHNLRPLARDGLVALVADPLDGRSRRVTLTPDGWAKRRRCQPLWRAAQDHFDRSFGTEPSRALRDSLAAIARHAEGTAAPVPEKD
ncbi:MarR family winged helix-turn-helix transcriptional regulator [Lichenibacterium ramalinae]|jgi:DNA-binding MarR family transcriptional regulator|uniref:MarR family transcriptional regulator n=1 Tax=Lichenibacterium ramalinae TaxID=2316527 RepID=A0A4Q2RGB6_9HYPH|nr:MarR family transcriptional regulator [Lichenibacterium ramalinae]RYB05590.1 MarR family transcriptional regulator [Lichenibacterium ramalinae]